MHPDLVGAPGLQADIDQAGRRGTPPWCRSGSRSGARRRPPRTGRPRTGAARSARRSCRAAGPGAPGPGRGSACPPHARGTPLEQRCRRARSWPPPSEPVVLASSRCTMPCRSAAPLVAVVCPAASRPCMHRRAGPARCRVGGHARSGLSTTMMSSSSYTMARPSHRARGLHRPRRGGRVTSSHSPAETRSDLAARPAADQDHAVADQLGGPGTGQAEHPGQGGVEAFTVQPVRDRHANADPRLRHRLPSVLCVVGCRVLLVGAVCRAALSG